MQKKIFIALACLLFLSVSAYAQVTAVTVAITDSVATVRSPKVKKQERFRLLKPEWVELRGERTEKGKTYLTPNRRLATVVFAAPVHYSDPVAGWVEVDLADRDTADGEYDKVVHAGKFNILYSSQRPGWMKFQSEHGWVEYRLNADTSNIEIQYDITPKRIKETIVLLNPAAPSRLAWKYNHSGVLEKGKRGKGAAKVKTADGRPVAAIAEMTAVDALGDNVPLSAAHVNDSLIVLLNVVGATHPIYLDPSMTIQDTVLDVDTLSVGHYIVGTTQVEWDHARNLPEKGLTDYSNVVSFDPRANDNGTNTYAVRGFMEFDLTGYNGAVVDSAFLYTYVSQVSVPSDTVHIIEGTWTGPIKASTFNDFTGWTGDSTAYSGVIHYTDSLFVPTVDSAYSVAFTAAGRAALGAGMGADTLRMAVLQNNDVTNTLIATDYDNQVALDRATTYIIVYYALRVSVASTVSGGLLLVADTTLDYAVHDSSTASSISTTNMTIGYFRESVSGKFHVSRTALTFGLNDLEYASAVDSASLFVYIDSVVDSLDLVITEGTFSGAIATSWFNDFTGWDSSGVYSSMVDYVDSVRIANTDTSTWVELTINAAGRAALVAVMGEDSLRMMGMSSVDVLRKPPNTDFPTDSSGWGSIDAVDSLPYLKISYTQLRVPNVITNNNVDTLHVLGSRVYAVLGGRIDSVGDGIDSVGFRYHLTGDAGNLLYTVADSDDVTFTNDSFYVTTATADTLAVDTSYVVTAFAVNGTHRIFSTVNDTISTVWTIPTLWEDYSTLGTASDSVRANPVRAIWADVTGRIWLGTAMGLYRQASNTTLEQLLYDDSSFAQVSRNNILSGGALPDSTVYTGSMVGLTLHDTLSLTDDSLITTALPDSVVWIIEADSGSANQIWGAGGGYLWLWDDSITVTYSTDSGMAGPVVHDIAIDSTYSIWIATNAGVSRILGGYWITYNTTNSSLNGNENYTIAVAGNDSSIWFGGDDGLVRFDGDTTWTDYSDSLPNYRVKDIIFNPVTLTVFIATDSGVVGYMPEVPAGRTPWRRYYPSSTSDSLPQYRIQSLAADTAGRLWVGHSTGVTRLTETF